MLRNLNLIPVQVHCRRFAASVPRDSMELPVGEDTMTFALFVSLTKVGSGFSDEDFGGLESELEQMKQS